MTGILGSGFGLYGYLPAVVRAGKEKVILLSKSKEIFLRRPELQFCQNHIEWVSDIHELMQRSARLILALPPLVQYEYLTKYLKVQRFDRLVLEKPLAVSPADAAIVLSLLAKTQTPTRAGYTFLVTNWARKTIKHIEDGASTDTFQLTWNFYAHHYKNDLKIWKRYRSHGGGVVRFYGIQVLAFLSAAGYKEVVTSECEGFDADDLYSWNATFKGPKVPPFDISVNCYSPKTQFVIGSSPKSFPGFRMTGPFDEGRLDSPDNRSDALDAVLASFGTENDADAIKLYEDINVLWGKVEEKTFVTVKKPS
jgi:predicted dehydrogenase